MRNIIVAGLLLLFYASSTSCANKGEGDLSKTDSTKSTVNSTDNGVIHLNEESFKKAVFDFENNKEWNYIGKVPAIIDFYADWCGPCRMVAPLLADIQKQYGGKIQVYKINTDEQRNLAAMFGIQSLPTILFVPVDGQPQAVLGYQPKEELDKIILDVLKVQK